MLDNYSMIIEYVILIDGVENEHKVVAYGDFLDIHAQIAAAIHERVLSGEYNQEEDIEVTQIFTLVHTCATEPFDVNSNDCDCIKSKRSMLPTFTWDPSGKQTIH